MPTVLFVMWKNLPGTVFKIKPKESCDIIQKGKCPGQKRFLEIDLIFQFVNQNITQPKHIVSVH